MLRYIVDKAIGMLRYIVNKMFCVPRYVHSVPSCREYLGIK